MAERGHTGLTRRRFATGSAAALLAGTARGRRGAAQTASPEAGGRVVVHPLGEAFVPAAPRRVVVLDPHVALPTLLELHVPIVGAGAQYATGSPFQEPYLRPEEVANITSVGEADAPNFEAVAALHPDLIIGWVNYVEPVYATLNAIAPTVATDASGFRGDRWQEDLRTLASIVGEEGQLDDQLAAFAERAADLKTRIEEQHPGLEVSVARIATDAIELYYQCAWPGPVLAEAGLNRPAIQRVDDCSATERLDLGVESIPDIDGDALFYFVRGFSGDAEAGAATADRWLAGPLWNRLAAVQAGQAFAVDADVWGPNANLRAAHLVLDDLERLLLDESASAAPEAAA